MQFTRLDKLAAQLLRCLALLLLPTRAYADAATGLPVYVEDRATIDPRDDGTERYLTLGLLTRPTGGAFGARAQLDLVGFAGFTLGAAGTLFGRAEGTLDDASLLQASAVGYLAYTSPLWRTLRLRAQLGYGAGYRRDADMTTGSMVISTPRIVDGSVLLMARGNHDWSVVGGPIVSRTLAGDTTVMVLVGLQRRF